MLSARAAYRARQLWRALRATVGGADEVQIAAYLTPPQRRLFYSMSLADQRHCLDVFYTLKAWGVSDHDLLVAALLHDVGKGELRLWQRGAYVLLRLLPPLLRWLAHPQGAAWRRALYALHHHQAWGAKRAASAGCSQTVLELIRYHEHPKVGSSGRLALLRAADDIC